MTYEVGQRIVVSNGEARPPERFNKKLAAWKNKNYSGVIDKIEEPREYQPNGALIVIRDDYPDRPGIKFRFHLVIGGSLTISSP